MADESLGDQIANARGKMTQEELSAALKAHGLVRGGSVRAIQDWESNRRRPHPRTLGLLRMILELEGDEQETIENWPHRVRAVTDALRDLLTTLPPDELRKWRHEFIVRLVQQAPGDIHPTSWPDDAEVVTEIVGAWLVAETDYTE